MAEVKELVTKLVLENTQLKKELAKTEDSFKKVGSKVDSTAKAIKTNWLKVLGVVAVVGVAVKKAFDISKQAAKFQQSMTATRKQFGVDADKMLKKLREVSDGTVADTSLITAANKAMALNVTKDIDVMAQIFEVARVRGRALGVETEQAFSDLVLGIGRGSPLILDNLGIITKGWAEEAKATGVAYDSQFILNKVLADGAVLLKKTGDLTLTTAERFDKSAAAIKNIQLALGEQVLEEVGVFAEELDKIGDAAPALENVGRAVTGIALAIQVSILSLRTGLTPIILLIKGIIGQVKDVIEITRLMKEKDFAGALGVIKEIPEQVVGALVDTKDSFVTQTEFIIEAWKRMTAAVNEDTAATFGPGGTVPTTVEGGAAQTAKELTSIAAAQLSTKEKIAQASFGAISELNKRALDAELAAAEGNEKKQKDIKTRAFQRQKAADIIQSIINTHLAVTRALTEGGLVGPILATGIKISGAIQTALIASQPIPKFAKGGVIKGIAVGAATAAFVPAPKSIGAEDGIIAAQNGESVLNKGATANLGESGVNALNSGDSIGDTTINIYVQDGAGAVDTLDEYFRTRGTSERGLAL